jgi:F0F1-type ATP synthase gamma subunit
VSSEDLGRLEQRLEALEAVCGVVHALGAIARAQLPEVEERVGDAQGYLEEVDACVARLVHRSVSAGPRLTVVLGPERAFCGSLPRELAKVAKARMPVVLIGRRLTEAASLLGVSTEAELSGPTSALDLDLVAERMQGRDVVLVHPRPGGVAEVVLLGGPATPAPGAPELFSPREVVLAAAVRESVSARLHLALARALHAEVSGRLAASEAARTAIERKRDELLATWRVARHERITTELLELVSGRAAFER